MKCKEKIIKNLMCNTSKKKKTYKKHVVLLWLLCDEQAKVRQQCVKHETILKKPLELLGNFKTCKPPPLLISRA